MRCIRAMPHSPSLARWKLAIDELMTMSSRRSSRTRAAIHSTSRSSDPCRRLCDACPADARCGKNPNFCLRGRCEDCADAERMMAERRRVVEHLGGLDLRWPRPVPHPVLPELPDHLPVLVQAYADPMDLPWVALHGGRVFGTAGRWVTRKHRRPVHEVYRLGPDTRVTRQLYVDHRT